VLLRSQGFGVIALAKVQAHQPDITGLAARVGASATLA
jgi:hypothetical protein